MGEHEVRFCNLHQHTTESHLDAICNIEDLFDRAKELGQKAIAVTDHGSMGGIYKAYKAYKRTGVKLIPGNEIYFTPDLDAPAKDPETKEKNPQARRYHLVLLAMNEKGYQNLLRVTYEGFKNSVTVMNKEFPRVDETILRKYSEGLFALSACGGNIIAQSIFRKEHDQAVKYAEMLKGVYGDRFFMEIQPHGIKRGEFSQIMLNGKMKEIAEEIGASMVATCDAHYITQADEKYHDMVLAISDKKSLEDLSRHTYTIDVLCDVCTWGWIDKLNKIKCTNPACAKGVVAKKPCPEFYLKSEDEVKKFFTEHFDAEFADQLITNVSDIADQCEPPDYIEPNGIEHIPTFDSHHISQCPDFAEFKAWKDKTGADGVADDVAYLRFSVWKGFMQYMKKRNFSAEKKDEYWKRAKFEISVLESRNFSSYMLVVADYIRWARDNGVLVGPGRGSVGGCLVAFLIGIHRVDPIKYGLFFERFHNLQKKSLPDIDTDFAPSGRERVFNYCKVKYGEENVAYISNLNRFTPKVVLTDVIRSLVEGGDKSTAFRIAKAVTSEIPDKVHEGERIIQVDNMEKAVKYARGTVFKSLIEKNPEILEYATAIVGLPRNYSTHAGGVVISDIPLPDFVPVRRDKKGAFAIQYEKNQAEENGLVKMDFLGLTTLDIISEILEQSKRIGIDLPDLDTLCVDETEHEGAYKVLASGLTTGCFQIEGHTLQPLCKPMQAKSIEDIALINALGRPSCSPTERKQFISRRNGEEKVTYPHRLLEDILKGTHGISIYEEDLLQLAPEIAGWDLSEADGLRKVTKLKEKGAALADQLEKKFINDCMERKQLTSEEGQFIWDQVIIPYSKYGFNKAHAIAYSMLGYATAYYKMSSRAPFFASVLNAKLRSKSKSQDHEEYLAKIKRDAKKYKVAIATCDINRSSQYYVATDVNHIVTGLGAVKGLGASALDHITSTQPYSSLEDFMVKNPAKVNKNHVQALAKAGAFDSFGLSRKYIHDHFVPIRDKWKKHLKKAPDTMFIGGDRAKPLLDQILDTFSYDHEDQKGEEWGMQEKLEYEKEVLGEYVSGSPRDLYPDFFSGTVYDTDFKSIALKSKGDSLLFEGMITATREFKIKKEGKNKGRRMGQITVENLKGESTNITVWCETWEANETAFNKGDVPVQGEAYVNQDRHTKETSWALSKIRVHSKRRKRST